MGSPGAHFGSKLRSTKGLNWIHVVDMDADVVESSSGVGSISVAPHPFV